MDLIPQDGAQYERESARRFLEFDYPETKDLAKQFLTLVSAALVFSVTFAEKVVGLNQPRGLLLGAWAGFLAAIALAGGSLLLIFVAGAYATHQPERRALRRRQRFWANLLLCAAGAAFTGGLGLLIAASLNAARPA